MHDPCARVSGLCRLTARFVNKTLLAHSHTHLFTHTSLWLLSGSRGGVESVPHSGCGPGSRQRRLTLSQPLA